MRRGITPHLLHFCPFLCLCRACESGQPQQHPPASPSPIQLLSQPHSSTCPPVELASEQPFSQGYLFCQEMGTTGQSPLHSLLLVFRKVRVFLTVTSHIIAKSPPSCTADAQRFEGGTKLPTAPTITIWGHPPGVKEMGCKYCWAQQTSFHCLPTPLLEGSWGRGMGGHPQGWFRKGALVLAWVTLVAADSKI